MNVDVSPDGETIVFDLLGDLYVLPIEGGDAMPLTSGTAWDQAPRFSPDGERVYFVSDREGSKSVWQLTLVGLSTRQITRSDTPILGGLNWSQNGKRLLSGAKARDGTTTGVVLHSIDPVSGEMAPVNTSGVRLNDDGTRKQVRRPSRTYSGVESADGAVFFSEAQPTADWQNFTIRLYEFDRKSQTLSVITQPRARYHDYKPQLSHDGNLLAYFRHYSERCTELRILNRASGKDDALVVLTDADYAGYIRRDDLRPGYAFAPDDKSVVFWHAGGIHRVELAEVSMKAIPFRVTVEREVATRVLPALKRLDGEANSIRWPSFSADGRTLVFSAFGHVWVMDVPTGEFRRLSNSADFEYMPTISPDGSSVAYISFESSGDEHGAGRLMVADIDGRQHLEVLADSEADYLMPRWSPDGSMIALIREDDRKRGNKAAFGWTSMTTGKFHKVASATGPNNHAMFSIYARNVQFDAAGERLVFSFPRSNTETVLMAADLDGVALETLAISTAEIGGITPAPDLKKLTLTRHDGTIWLIPFEAVEETTVVTSLAPNARRVSRNGGYYVYWDNSEQFTFGFGKDVYRYRLDDSDIRSIAIRLPYTKSSAAQPLAFTGARLITMSGDVGSGPIIESGAVVVVGSRIVAVGPTDRVEIPSNARVVDSTGKTIMPGLLDTHYHSMMGERTGSALVFPDFDNGDHTAITFGVTTAWIPGGRLDDGVPATADLQTAARVVGPRVSQAARGSVGEPYEALIDYTAALAAVSRHRELGANVLKEYNVPTRRQRQWLVAAAHENELGIVSHLETFDGTLTRVIDGYTGGDHPSLPASLYKDVVELLRQTGYIWTPDILTNVTTGITGTHEDKERLYCEALVEKQRQGGLSNPAAESICGPSNESPTETYDFLRASRIAKSIALAADNGVNIGVSAHNKPASGLHREMWLLWKGGMSIVDVLRATTMVNAEKLGLHEEIGSLEVGKIADLLVLNENPLDDILNTLSLQYTVQGGVVYDSTTAEKVDVSSLGQAAQTFFKAANDELPER